MKFYINREQLLVPLQHIVNVIEKRQTMPILSNVLITLGRGYVVLTGTDLEIQLVVTLAIENTEEGSLTIPARKLLDICRLLPTQAVISIDSNNDKIKITSGRSRFALSALPAQNYPKFIETDFTHQFITNAGKLKLALEKTIFCMAVQDVRFFLNGLLLNISNQKFKLVASDGHRLAIYEDQLDYPTGFEAKIVLPRKGVIELAKLLDNPEAEIDIQFSDNNIKVSMSNLVFSAKLVDAKYPDYSKVFNQAFFNPITFSKQPFKEALTRVAILSNDKIKGVMFDFSKDSVKISAYNPEHEEAEEDIEVEYNEEPISIAFNVQYLLDALSNLDSETANIKIAANASTCFIDSDGNQSYKYIVMSMRL
jgi:DNA polymerase III subunit beta